MAVVAPVLVSAELACHPCETIVGVKEVVAGCNAELKLTSQLNIYPLSAGKLSVT